MDLGEDLVEKETISMLIAADRSKLRSDGDLMSAVICRVLS